MTGFDSMIENISALDAKEIEVRPMPVNVLNRFLKGIFRFAISGAAIIARKVVNVELAQATK